MINIILIMIEINQIMIETNGIVFKMIGFVMETKSDQNDCSDSLLFFHYLKTSYGI